MPLTYTEGDPFLTNMQTVGVGVNVQARSEVTPFNAELARRYPTAVASFRKQARAGRVGEGDVWVWRDSTPRLAFCVVRSAPTGATRPRFVDRVAHRLARDHALDGIMSIALGPLGRAAELASIREALALVLPTSPLPVVAYTAYLPGVAGEAE